MNIQNQQNEENVSSVTASTWYFIWDLLKVFLIAFGLVWLIIRPFIAEPFIVSGASMVPNFHNHDYLVVEKLSYRAGEVKRGDIIVFKYPNDPKQYFIKRVIGLPGDEVLVTQGHVSLKKSGDASYVSVKEDYIPSGVQTNQMSEVAQWKLGSDQFFVLGDNREHSSDSRSWGVLPRANIVGKVWVRVLPVGDIGVIHHESGK